MSSFIKFRKIDLTVDSRHGTVTGFKVYLGFGLSRYHYRKISIDFCHCLSICASRGLFVPLPLVYDTSGWRAVQLYICVNGKCPLGVIVG